MIPDFDTAKAIENLIASGIPEEQARLLVSGFVDSAEMEAIHSLAAGMIEDVLVPTAQNAALALVTEQTPQVAIDTMLDMATNQARIQAGTLATNLTTAELNKIGGVIADGLANGENAVAIRSRLTMVTELDSNRARQLDKYGKTLDDLDMAPDARGKALQQMKDSLVRERRYDIAQNEQGVALEEAGKVAATARGDTHKTWITSMDDKVCDICAGNEAQGPIPINQAFQSGDMTPPGHPGHCHCTVAYSQADTLDIDRELAQESAAITADARESA